MNVSYQIAFFLVKNIMKFTINLSAYQRTFFMCEKYRPLRPTLVMFALPRFYLLLLWWLCRKRPLRFVFCVFNHKSNCKNLVLRYGFFFTNARATVPWYGKDRSSQTGRTEEFRAIFKDLLVTFCQHVLEGAEEETSSSIISLCLKMPQAGDQN